MSLSKHYFTTAVRKCPFCGGEIKVKDTELNKFKNWPIIGRFLESCKNYYVECVECEADSAYYENPQKAIDAWNKRYVMVI